MVDEHERAPEGLGHPSPDRRPPRLLRSRPVLAAAVACGLVVLVAVGLAALRGRPRANRVTAGEVPGGHVLAPIEAERDAAADEDVAPFSGFAVHVETDPPGALVSVAGVPRGEAPVLAGVDCGAGERVEIRAARPGRAPAVRTTRCRTDALVRLTVRRAR